MKRPFLTSSSLLLLILFAGLSYPLPAQERPPSHQDSITLEELRDHLFYLASDELNGRDTGSAGYQLAAQYAASQFREAGLKTVFKDADGKGTYLQQVEFVFGKFSDETQAYLLVGEDETSLKNGESILVIAEGESGGMLAPTESVFLGFGIEQPQVGWNDYSTIDPAGKVVFIVPSAPVKGRKNVLPEKVNQIYRGVDGLIAKAETAAKHKAVAVVIILAGVWANQWDGLAHFLNQETLTFKGSAGSGVMPAPIPTLLMHPSATAKAFEGSGYDPVSGKGECIAKGLSGVEVGMMLKKDISRSLNSPNVVGMIEGRDPVLRDQYIVIGAHLDHVGVKAGEIYNGADDNASGSVAVIEAAEALATAPPRRSVIFVLYTGEEKGLLGSKSFLNNCPVPVENIVLNINLDMVGRNDKDFPDGIYVIGSDRRSKELKRILIETNENTVKLPLDFRFDENDPLHLWERSDHAYFHKKGIPVIFFTSGLFSELHKPADDAEKINYEKIRSVAQLCYELTQAVGNRDERLKIDDQ